MIDIINIMYGVGDIERDGEDIMAGDGENVVGGIGDVKDIVDGIEVEDIIGDTNGDGIDTENIIDVIVMLEYIQ